MAEEKRQTMIWNEQAEAKLFAAVLTTFEVKVSGEKLQTLADTMGCTPKAITHRIQNIRARGKNIMDGVEPTTPVKRKGKKDSGGDTETTTPAAKKKRATPKKTPKAATNGKRDTGDNDKVNTETDEMNGDEKVKSETDQAAAADDVV